MYITFCFYYKAVFTKVKFNFWFKKKYRLHKEEPIVELMDYSTQRLHWILELGWDTEKRSMLTGKIRCKLEKLKLLLWTLLKKEVNYIPQLRLEEEKSKCYSVVSRAKLTSWGTLGHFYKNWNSPHPSLKYLML